MTTPPLRVTGLTEALERVRLSRPQQQALSAELANLARALQSIDLILQGLRTKGDLPPEDDEVEAPDLMPNTLYSYLEVQPIQPED